MALAQLDRVFGYEPKGRGFESLMPRLKQKGHPKDVPFALRMVRAREALCKAHRKDHPRSPKSRDLPPAVRSTAPVFRCADGRFALSIAKNTVQRPRFIGGVGGANRTVPDPAYSPLDGSAKNSYNKYIHIPTDNGDPL